MKKYISADNQTLLDICLVCYGSLDYLAKLSNDNNINLITPIPANTVIYYDDKFTKSQINYTTAGTIYKNFPIIILTQPESATICTLGGSSSITLYCIGDSDYNYQWQRSDFENGTYVNINDGIDYLGSQTTSLKVELANFINTDYWYRCKVDGVNSIKAELKVGDGVVLDMITETWAGGAPTESNGVVRFESLLLSGTPLSYNWQFKPLYGSSYTTITNSNSITGITALDWTTNALTIKDFDYSLNGTEFKITANTPYCGFDFKEYTITDIPVTYYPPLSFGTSSLFSLFVARDAVGNGINDHAINPIKDRFLPLSSVGYENLGGAYNARLYGLNNFTTLYFGPDSTPANPSLGLTGSSAETGVMHIMNNYNAYNFGTSSAISIAASFNIMGTYSYDNSSYNVITTLDDVYVIGSMSSTRKGAIVYTQYTSGTGSNKLYSLTVECGGNIGLSKCTWNNLKENIDYCLVANLDKTNPTQQVYGYLQIGPTASITVPDSVINVNNTNYFQNSTFFSPVLGGSGYSPLANNFDGLINVVAYFTGTMSVTDRNVMLDWMYKQYGY